MRGLASIAIICLVASGCLGTPEPTPPTPPSEPTPPTAPSEPTPPTAPTTTPAPRLSIRTTPARIAPGETMTVTLELHNDGSDPLWTNPSFVCTGSWDHILYDGDGEAQRIDDRDSMGCPSGGPLTRRIGGGESLSANFTWDSRLRPSLGQSRAAPPGEYTWEGRATYVLRDGADRNDASANTLNATATITVAG